MTKLAIDDESVKQALSGIFKSGKTTFFRIVENNQHVKVNVSAILRTLDASHGTASRILATFPWPQLQYYSEAMKEADAGRGKPKGRQRKVSSPVVDDEEDEFEDLPEEDPLEESLSTVLLSDAQLTSATGRTVPKAKKNKRQHYQLITQGDYWGCFNSEEVTVTLFKTRREAELHIYRLQKQREVYKAFYSSGNNSNRHNEY